jgi:cytochrome c oxidase assembly protein subunit 15
VVLTWALCESRRATAAATEHNKDKAPGALHDNQRGATA